MVYVNRSDLKHILDQIVIAEQHSQGTPLTELIANPLLPYGLRTVDGSLNNLTQGREELGAADRAMPRLLDSTFLTSAQTGSISVHDAQANPRTGESTSYLQTTGSVYDSEPRIISNLIADQTLANPAAIAAALSHSGLTGQAMLSAATAIATAYQQARAAQAATGNVDQAIALQRTRLQSEVDAALAAFNAAQANVETLAAAKTTADQAAAAAQQSVDAAGQTVTSLQNTGALGEATAVLTNAQSALTEAENALAAAEAALQEAQAAETSARNARDAKQSEVNQLEIEKAEADNMLSAAQAALSDAQGVLNSLTDTSAAIAAAETTVAGAQTAVATAQGVVADVTARLNTAQADLDALSQELQAAEFSAASAQQRVTTAQEAASASQAAFDAAQSNFDAITSDAALVQSQFLAAFSAFMAGQSSISEMVQAATAWSAARGGLAAVETELAAARLADQIADTELEEATQSLTDAQQLVTSLTNQLAVATTVRDNLAAEKQQAEAVVASAVSNLQSAQNDLASLTATNAAYLAAQQAVSEAETAVTAAVGVTGTVAQALSAAQGELATLEAHLTTASGEVTRLEGVVGAATTAVSGATADVTIAEQDVASAQAQSEQVIAALDQLSQALLDLAAANLAAEEAASALNAAATERDGLQVVHDTAVANLAAIDAPDAAEAALAAAQLAVVEAQGALDGLLTTHGIEMDGDNIRLPDVSPDEGLSAPVNSWMTLFGQFFDHGLDLVGKGGSGTVFIPLQPDDPLYVEGSPTNFMVLTRATNQPGPDGILGTADDIREHVNKTTPWVDQNQTYTSHPSHHVFLREYEFDADGRPVSNGYLLHGQSGGMSTWGDVKAQAAQFLGIKLNDADVLNGPLLATDAYGNFIPGANGLPQLVVANPDFVDGGIEPEHILVEGNLASPVDASQAVRNGHAFLEDIAHSAVPGTFVVNRFPDGTTETAQKTPDADAETGNAIIPNQFGQNETYDNELLDRHYIGGDGRANENFGLTAVHHVFHSEHNRQVLEMKQTILDSGDPDFINQWLHEPIDAASLETASLADLDWNGERLFQAARFATEMQYQHLAFEEFGRRVQPQIAGFAANASAEIDGSIFAEFAHVVYRFGHSMLTENVHTMTPDGQNLPTDLITAFLNPVAFEQDGALTSDQAAGAVARGMSRETSSNIDEFVTSALRDNLVGLPLDLAALNIARGRDTGVPSLNAAREQFYAVTGSEFLKPYENWSEYAANLKNPASIINFIAAYGTHQTIVNATTVADKRAAATDLVLGGDNAPPDRLDFVNGTGTWASQESGINAVEFWIGGLAESIMPFGGMLGSTFGFVFQHQMENLQNADRFYYLSRTAGMNMLAELENNSFASMIVRNTDIADGGAHVPADIFSSMDYILEVDQAVQAISDPAGADLDPFLAAMGGTIVERATATVDAPIVHGVREYDNFLKFNGGEHVVLGGTNQRDVLVGGLGDDALWGDDGDDLLIGGAGVNTLRGGAGDDILKDGDDISFLHGEDGDDVISAGGGAGELIFGGKGNDVIFMGMDDFKEAFGGEGNDFIMGGAGADVVFGGEGNDWIEGGDGFDLLMGDNFAPLGASPVIGHDVLIGGPNDNDLLGESGDDILIQGEGIQVNDGDLGYDWVAHKNAGTGADIDLARRLELPGLDAIRDRYINTEAASGTAHDDLLYGDNREGAALPAGIDLLNNTATFFGNELTQAGIDRIEGLRELIGELIGTDPADTFTGGNILLGGGGSDTIQGRGGDDVIDGDKHLNVRISVRDPNDPNVELRSIDSLGEISTELLDGSIKPVQLQIVREIIDGGQAGDTDVAVYFDVRANYNIRANADGSVTVDHINVPTAVNLGVDANNGQPNPAGGDGRDTLWNIEILRFADQEIDLRTDPVANGVIVGTPLADQIDGTNGPDAIFAGSGNDTVNGLGGNDVVFAEGGSDTIVWTAPAGGTDIVDGGVGDTDTFVANGDASAEVFRVYAAASWTGDLAQADTEIVVTRTTTDGAETVIAELRNIEEIQINTGDGNDTVEVVGDFNPTSLNFNTITINGTGGDDSVNIENLTSAHRVLFRTEGGNNTIVGTVREQDVVVLPAGTVLANLTRSEENGMVTLSDGARSVSFMPAEVGAEPGLVVAGTPAEALLVNAGTVNAAGVFQLPRGQIALTQTDVAALSYMITGKGTPPALPPEEGELPGQGEADFIIGFRDMPGLENNQVNPGFGAATEPYIRITEARYGAEEPETGNRAVNPIFKGLDPRDISNTLGHQDAGLAKAATANMFMMAFGQYFDHGLTFIPKGGNGMIEIGGPGMSRAPGSDNPADLTRATVTGFDANGTPEHTNITSPFVDQNQVYGSSVLVCQLLRESDGNGGLGARVLLGQPDPSNPGFKLMATLRELLDHHIDNRTVFTGTDQGDVTLLEYYPGLRDEDGSYNAALVADLSADFMGEGWPLLIDKNPFMNLLDHYVGGDGRANENIGLTAMHTVWARNHDYHVELLQSAGFVGTQDELFEAAKALNEAEYQQVVFNDFADALLGGLEGSGRHGHDEYDPATDARISHEFAAAAYRFGHSQIGQTLTVLDADGNSTSVPLFDAFLNPTNDLNAFVLDTNGDGTVDLTGVEAVGALAGMGYVPQPGYAQHGVGAILGGMVQQPSEEIDFNVVDAVRNDLVRVSADLFSFNVARGWDVGLGTLNQVKKGLAASTDRYVQEAIEFSDRAMEPYSSWEDFQSRNGLSDEVIAQFQQAYPDLILTGDEIAEFQQANPDVDLVPGENGAMVVKGIDRVDLWVGGLAESHIKGGVVGHTFWVILHEQFDRLQEGDRFYYLDRVGDLPVYNNFIGNISFGDIVARNTGLTDLPLDVFSYNGDNVPNDVAPTVASDAVQQAVEETPAAPATDQETPSEETPTEEVPNTQEASPEADVDEGAASEAATEEALAEDNVTSTEVAGASQVLVGSGNGDVLIGTAETRVIVAGDAADVIIAGDAGVVVEAGDGNNVVTTGSGADIIFSGNGNDLIDSGFGSDKVWSGDGDDQIYAGDGNDVIWAGAGDDEVHGGGGDDRIDGGLGADLLFGGDGNDTFVFRTAEDAQGDVIGDFQAGDVVNLHFMDADETREGNNAFELASGTSFTAAGQLIISYDGDSDTTVVQGNTDGDTSTAEFEMSLIGNHEDLLKNGGTIF